MAALARFKSTSSTIRKYNPMNALRVIGFFPLSLGVLSADLRAADFTMTSVSEVGISQKNGNFGFTFDLTGSGQVASPQSLWSAGFNYRLAGSSLGFGSSFKGFDTASVSLSVQRELGSGFFIAQLGTLPMIEETGVSDTTIHRGMSFGVENFSNGFSTHVFTVPAQNDYSAQNLTLQGAIGFASKNNQLQAWDLGVDIIPNAFSLQFLGYSGQSLLAKFERPGKGRGWGASANVSFVDGNANLQYSYANTVWAPETLGQERGTRNNLKLNFSPMGSPFSLGFELEDTSEGFYSPLATGVDGGVWDQSFDVAYFTPGLDLSIGYSRRRITQAGKFNMTRELSADIRYTPRGRAGDLSLTGQFLVQENVSHNMSNVANGPQTNVIFGAVGFERSSSPLSFGGELGLIRTIGATDIPSTEVFANAFVTYEASEHMYFSFETSLTRQSDVFEADWDREVSFELQLSQIANCCALGLSGTYVDYNLVDKPDLLIAQIELTRELSARSELVFYARQGRGSDADLENQIKGAEIGIAIRKTSFITR